MKIHNFAESNSIINHYMAEMRDKSYQKNRLLKCVTRAIRKTV